MSWYTWAFFLEEWKLGNHTAGSESLGLPSTSPFFPILSATMNFPWTTSPSFLRNLCQLPCKLKLHFLTKDSAKSTTCSLSTRVRTNSMNQCPSYTVHVWCALLWAWYHSFSPTGVYWHSSCAKVTFLCIIFQRYDYTCTKTTHFSDLSLLDTQKTYSDLI